MLNWTLSSPAPAIHSFVVPVSIELFLSLTAPPPPPPWHCLLFALLLKEFNFASSQRQAQVPCISQYFCPIAIGRLSQSQQQKPSKRFSGGASGVRVRSVQRRKKFELFSRTSRPFEFSRGEWRGGRGDGEGEGGGGEGGRPGQHGYNISVSNQTSPPLPPPLFFHSLHKYISVVLISGSS